MRTIEGSFTLGGNSKQTLFAFAMAAGILGVRIDTVSIAVNLECPQFD
jgi:hypothetical protein